MFRLINKLKKLIFCNKEDFKLFLVVLFSIFVAVKFIIYFSEYHLGVKFKRLPPMSVRVSPAALRTKVILNGVQVGEAQEMRLAEDVSYTLVKIKLYKKYHLPLGTVAKLKPNLLEENFIELVLPDKDSKQRIREHQVLQGYVSDNVKAVLNKHLEDGSLNNMINSVKGAMSNADKTSKNLEEGTNLIVEILTENRENISNTIKNFSATSENVKNFTANMNKVLEDQVVSNKVKTMLTSASNSMENVEKLTSKIDFEQSAKNIKDCTENVKESTQSLKAMMQNFSNASKHIECTTAKLNCSMGTTLKKTHSLLEEGVDTVKSVKHLSNGMSQTMSHRFLFWKFMFGKPGVALENPPTACAAAPVCNKK